MRIELRPGASRARLTSVARMRTTNLIANRARSRRHEHVAARQRDAQQSETRFELSDHASQRDGSFRGGRQHRIGVGLQFRERTDSDDVALIEKHHLIGEALDLGHVVGDVENRQREMIAQLFDEGENLFLRPAIQRRKGSSINRTFGWVSKARPMPTR